jgi:histone acetyltransferase (RNA polymerase elongator complex component)
VPEGKSLSPAAEKQIREYALEQTTDNLESLHKMLLSDAATVDMRELGYRGGEEEDTAPDAEGLGAKFLEEAEKIAEEKKISLGEAVSLYAKEHPKEFNAYQESVGGLRGGMMEVK